MKIDRKILLVALLIACSFILLNYFIPNRYIVRIVIFTNIAAVLAASWDVIGGYCGMPNFGHAAFYGIGAYAAGYFAGGHSPYAPSFLMLPPWLAVVLGSLIAVMLSLLVTLTSLRKKGPYLAIITLMFPFILNRLALLLIEYSGAEEGISGITPLAADESAFYYISVFLFLFSAISLYGVTRSRIGLTWKAIRDDEDAAEGLGIDVSRYKTLAFAIGAFFAGLMGSFFAVYTAHVGIEIFSLNFSTMPIWYTIIGGMGTIVGPVVGAYVLGSVLEIFYEFQEFHALFFNILLIFVVLFVPSGLTKIESRVSLMKWLRKLFSKVRA